MDRNLQKVLLSVISFIGLVVPAVSIGADIVPPTVPHNDGGPYNANPVVIHAGLLLAVPGEDLLTERSIVVIEGSIQEVHEGYVTPAELGLAGAQVINLRESFVLPGLIDSHVHITSTAGTGNVLRWVTLSDADRAIWSAYNAAQTLQAGFTTIRDLAASRMGDGDAIYAIRDGIRMGKVPGPRVVAAGQAIGVTGTVSDFNGFRHEILDLFQNPAMCSGADRCREAVRYQIKRGADFIKIGSTGGASRESRGGNGLLMFDDELRAVVETAHKMDRKVTAHATSAEGVNAVLRAGVDAVEHGGGLDDTSIKLFKETGAYLVPTILAEDSFRLGVEQDPYLPADLPEKWARLGASYKVAARMAHAAGIKIALGTDVASLVPHGNNALEFRKLIEIGMTPMEAIVAATVNGADNIGLGDEIGTIERGKAADIIALDQSPLEDVTRLENVQFVMRNGVVYKDE